MQDKTVLAQFVKAEELAILKNRDISKRLIDATLFLAKQHFSFRGQREPSCREAVKDSGGNVLELVKLMAKYDSVLAQHIQYTHRNESCLSHQLQNDFIAALVGASNQPNFILFLSIQPLISDVWISYRCISDMSQFTE